VIQNLSERYTYAMVLLKELVRTDFKLRYQGSVLGYAWSLLKPLFMFAILYSVFTLVFKVGKGVENFPIYLLLGIVLWSFFTEMTQQSLVAIVGRGDLIRKIRIPRWLILISVSIGALINLALNLFVVLVISVVSNMDFRISSLWVPVFIIEIYLIALGLSLILSALYVKYRDMSYVWDIVLQAGFYATPILYPITVSSNLITNETVLKLLYINPVAQAIQGARNAFVTPETLTISEVWGSSYAVLMPLAVIVFFLGVGFLYFKRQAREFAENL
jgi:ABC-2 type transport system permease protein